MLTSLKGENMSFLTKTLAKEALSKYPCSVQICINPYYWKDKGSICSLGNFKPTEVDKLAKLIDEVSAQIYKETGFYINSIDWLDIFPEDMSLLESRNKEAVERLETFF